MVQECGTERIAGCQFNLSVMSDDFAEVILGALDQIDTSKVWKETDDVSTCVRGRIEHVFDVVQAIYLEAAKTGKHVEMSGTFSIGCPGDSSGDVYLEKGDELLNTDDTKQYVSSQFALYPMNNPDYMAVIYKEVERAKEHGVWNDSMHYASGIHGDIHNVFAFYEETFTHARTEEHRHLVMTVSMSINSPSHKEQDDA